MSFSPKVLKELLGNFNPGANPAYQKRLCLEALDYILTLEKQIHSQYWSSYGQNPANLDDGYQ